MGLIDPAELFLVSGLGYFSSNNSQYPNIRKDAILPEFRLELVRVSINSLGFWEIIGSLNPLHQLREYLNDRHERQKDKEYRKQSDKKRLEFENDLLRSKIHESEISNLSKLLQIMLEAGMSEQQINEIFWSRLGPPLAKLGKHQDSGLIQTACWKREDTDLK